MSETTLQTFNDTSSERINQTYNSFILHDTLIISSQIVSLFGLAGNAVVIWCLGFRIKRNPFTVYILNLAVADFLLLLSQSIWLLSALITRFSLTCIACIEELSTILKIIFVFGFSTSLLFLTTISMERCIAVVYPIWYKCRRPRYLSIMICFLLWIFSFTQTMIMFSCEYFLRAFRILHCNRVYWSYSIMSFGIFSPLLILSSLVLIIQIQRKSIKRQPKRLYGAILLNLLVFLVCTFPTRLIYFLIAHQIAPFSITDMLLILCVDKFLTTVNSSANPFIYFLVGRNEKTISRKSIIVALRRVFGSDTEEPRQDETHNLPGSRPMEGELVLSE